MSNALFDILGHAAVAGALVLATHILLGRQVLIAKYDLAVGLHQIKLDVSLLENGYHLIKMNKGEIQKVKSFIVQ